MRRDRRARPPRENQMDLKSLMTKPVNPKRRKIVGRGPGSGHGKQAGRGGKGSKARSGYSWHTYFEGGQMPLYRRLPKKGFKNGRFKKTYAIVNVRDLARFQAGATVDAAAVAEAGLIKD